jgi:hypothetical protein
MTHRNATSYCHCAEHTAAAARCNTSSHLTPGNGLFCVPNRAICVLVGFSDERGAQGRRTHCRRENTRARGPCYLLLLPPLMLLESAGALKSRRRLCFVGEPKPANALCALCAVGESNGGVRSFPSAPLEPS